MTFANITDWSKTGQTISVVVSRASAIGSRRLAGIIDLAKTVTASPSIIGFGGSMPSRSSKEHSLPEKRPSENAATIFNRISARDTALLSRRRALDTTETYFKGGALSGTGFFAAAVPLENRHRYAITSPSPAVQRYDENPHGRPRDEQPRERQERPRSIHQQLAALSSSALNRHPSEVSTLSRYPRRQGSLTSSVSPSTVVGDGGLSNRILGLARLGDVVQPLADLRGVIYKLAQAIRPSLELHGAPSSSLFAGTRGNPIDYTSSATEMTGSRGSRPAGSLTLRRSSAGSSMERRGVGAHLAPRLMTFTKSPLIASTLIGQLLGSRQAERLISRIPNSPPAKETNPVRVRPRAIGLSGDFLDQHNPITVNFSPTVMVSINDDHDRVETRVLNAIRQHSYELVRLIGREMQTQRRGAF